MQCKWLTVKTAKGKEGKFNLVGKVSIENGEGEGGVTLGRGQRCQLVFCHKQLQSLVRGNKMYKKALTRQDTLFTSNEAPFSLSTLRTGPHSGAPLNTGTMWVPESTYCSSVKGRARAQASGLLKESSIVFLILPSGSLSQLGEYSTFVE